MGVKCNMTERYDGGPQTQHAFCGRTSDRPRQGENTRGRGPHSLHGSVRVPRFDIRGSAWVGYLAAERLIEIFTLTPWQTYASAARQANSVAQTHAAFPGQDLNPLLVENNLVQQRIPGFKHPGGIAVLGQQPIQKP